MNNEIEVKALRNFPYSRFGWDTNNAIAGNAVVLNKEVAKRLSKEDPPFVSYETKENPAKDVVKDPVETKEVQTGYTLKDLELAVKDAKSGADEIIVGDYIAKQKSGTWYNVFKGEKQVNDSGVSRKKLASFIFDLYSEV